MANERRVTITTLKAALPEGAVVEEDLTEDGGAFTVYAPKWKAWTGTDTNVACCVYYLGDDLATRESAIRLLLEDVLPGTVDANEDTIHAMGW